MNSSSSRQKILLGGSSIIGIIIFVGIIAGLQYISLNNPVRWDLTQEKQHTLSSQSVKVTEELKENKEPVEVLAFYESKDQRSRMEASDLFDRYRDVWNGINYTFYDPDKERAIALQNKVDSYPTVIVRSRGKTERMTNVDEESFTNALVRLQRNEVKKVYFLKGHGELSTSSTEQFGLSIARENIEKQNYRTEDLLLLQSLDVPPDASIVIVAGPRTELMEQEIQSLERYLDRGGAMLVMLNPFQTPELAKNLSRYGFELTDDIVVDRMSQALGGDYLMPVITSYAQFPITKNFDVASFFPQARSVKKSSKSPDNVNAVELAFTSPASWTISESQLLSGSAEFDEKFGHKGPVTVMSVSTISPDPNAHGSDIPKKETKVETDKDAQPENATKLQGAQDSAINKPSGKSRIVVFGSSQFASNKFFKLQGNGDLFMNTVSWLAEDENLISIRPKSLKAQPVVLTAYDSLISFLVPVALTPLAVVFAGAVVFLYRRKNMAL